jgi:hypothetical protein
MKSDAISGKLNTGIYDQVKSTSNGSKRTVELTSLGHKKRFQPHRWLWQMNIFST